MERLDPGNTEATKQLAQRHRQLREQEFALTEIYENLVKLYGSSVIPYETLRWESYAVLQQHLEAVQAKIDYHKATLEEEYFRLLADEAMRDRERFAHCIGVA